MHCTRCGNPMHGHSKECPICHYVLTQDEYEEGLKEGKKETNKKPKKVNFFKVPVKKEVPQVKEENVKKEEKKEKTVIKTSEVIIDDPSRDTTNYISSTRYLGYLLLILSDVSLITGAWYMFSVMSHMYAIIFVLVSLALVGLGIYIIKSSGVTREHISKNSIYLSAFGLFVSIGSLILLLLDFSENSLLIRLISIGLLLIGVVSIGVSFYSGKKR